MKSTIKLLVVLALSVRPALADSKVKAGPRKGRLLEFGAQNAEGFVEKDRTISIAFTMRPENSNQPTPKWSRPRRKRPAARPSWSLKRRAI